MDRTDGLRRALHLQGVKPILLAVLVDMEFALDQYTFLLLSPHLNFIPNGVRDPRGYSGDSSRSLSVDRIY